MRTRILQVWVDDIRPLLVASVLVHSDKEADDVTDKVKAIGGDAYFVSEQSLFTVDEMLDAITKIVE